MDELKNKRRVNMEEMKCTICDTVIQPGEEWKISIYTTEDTTYCHKECEDMRKLREAQLGKEKLERFEKRLKKELLEEEREYQEWKRIRIKI